MWSVIKSLPITRNEEQAELALTCLTTTTKKAPGWNDVELLKKFDIASGDPNVRHTVNVTIPADRTGKAVIFTRRQRIDAVGEQVRFRLMGGTRGDNSVNVYLSITAQNINNNQWVVELGNQFNVDYSNELQIGQKGTDGNISFNEQLPRSNQVFVSNNDYGYAIEIEKNAETPVISLDRYTLDPIATASSAYNYAVTGESDKPGVSWQWKQVSGDSRITASPANQAKTQIRIPGGVNGGTTTTTFELTGTTANGPAGKATLKVNIVAPQVSPTGPARIASDKGGNTRKSELRLQPGYDQLQLDAAQGRQRSLWYRSERECEKRSGRRRLSGESQCGTG
uniref:hypothetical protein n=1 Tax=Scandinavium goeteborgense TaxID=1851514 RepID=UPI00135C52F0|nr:hypothetical protein [Scandinavium goeteborgense]